MNQSQFPELQVLSTPDLAEVQAFSRARANQADPFVEWSAPWRGESLEHYLKVGWSMSRRDPQTGKLLGYVLAQPFLFMRCQTQTVWIEYVEAETPKLAAELLETVVRVAREKHMQRVLVGFRADTDQGLAGVIQTYKAKAIEDDILEFTTTKA